MKKNSFFLTVLLAMILLPAVAKAQYIVDYKRQADNYFDHQNYYAAAVYYQKALRLLPDSTGRSYYLPYNIVDNRNRKRWEQNAAKYQYLIYQLGESFRLYKDYKSAEEWYAKVLRFPDDPFPLARLWYGVCLRADAKYRDALKQLETFQAAYSSDDEYSSRAALEIKSCRYAIDAIKYPRILTSKQLPEPVNEDSGSNYAVAAVNERLYFTSSRPYGNINDEKHNPFLNKIYTTKVLANGTYAPPQVLELSSKNRTQSAAPSLNPADSVLYLTQWEESGKKKRNGMHHLIAVSRMDASGKWTTATPLGAPVNIEGSDTKEAYVAMEGAYLVFSSNRPGGSGGYDLWFCRLDEAGLPVGDAINLGSNINSKGDEGSPYYHQQEGTLFYSSNGLVGLGGFDLFQSSGSLDQNSWSVPENLGYPINSAKDDIFYYPFKGSKRFYLSSDRNATCCLSIFQIHLRQLRLTGRVFDKKTGEVIGGTTVVLKDSITDEVLGTTQTDDGGNYTFSLQNRRPLTLHASKTQYIPQNKLISTRDLRSIDSLYRQDVYLVAYDTNKPIVIRNIYYDFDKASLRPKSRAALDTLVKLLMDNSQWIVEISAHTDYFGPTAYNQWLSQQRAQSVVDYLVEQGIPRDRLTAKGYGELRPIAPNKHPDGSDNPEGRQLNRRTEFRIIGIQYEQGKKTEKELYKSIIGDKSNIEVDNCLMPSLSRRR